MPGFNGTGPLGKGPMTGNGKGFCILKTDTEKPEKVEGYIGLQGKEYSKELTDPKSVKEKVSDSDTNIFSLLNEGGDFMPLGDGTGPVGLGPLTGRTAGFCAGYPVPGYMNVIPGQGFRTFGFGFFGRGRGFFGRGRGKGRGMGFQMMGRIPYLGSPYPISGIAPYAIPYFY